MAVVERGTKHGDEQAEAPAAEHVGRPVHVEVHTRYADEEWRKRGNPDRDTARDESFTPVDVRERTAHRGARRRVARRKRICAEQQMSDDRRPSAGEELFDQL